MLYCCVYMLFCWCRIVVAVVSDFDWSVSADVDCSIVAVASLLVTVLLPKRKSSLYGVPAVSGMRLGKITAVGSKKQHQQQ